MKLNLEFIFLSLILPIISKARLTKRIYGGVDTKLKDFPNVMSIQVLQAETQEYEHKCAAIVVDELWGLTSGQCLQDFDVTINLDDVRVKAGAWTVKVEEQNQQIVKIALYFKHEDMKISSTSKLFDIGLIKLAKKLEFNDYVKALPFQTEHKMFFEGDAVIVGWGIARNTSSSYFWSDGLKKLDVRLLNILYCRTAIRNLVDKRATKDDSDIIDGSNICSGPLSGLQFMCEDDKGGPLYIKIDSTYLVIGIISYTVLPYGRRGSPIVYTNISFYTQWMQDIMKANK